MHVSELIKAVSKTLTLLVPAAVHTVNVRESYDVYWLVIISELRLVNWVCFDSRNIAIF